MADWKRYNIEFALKKGKTEKDVFDALGYSGKSLFEAVMFALDVDDDYSPFQITSSADGMEHEVNYSDYRDTADSTLYAFIDAMEGVCDDIGVVY